jgi:hypothetical protein
MIGSNKHVEESSKCPNKFSRYDMGVDERFQFLAIAWHGWNILDHKASDTEDDDRWALSESKE